jgi:hypothetical protein
VNEHYDNKVASNLGAGALSPTGPHNEFLELCAVSTSGELTEAEQRKLEEHLAVCESCRVVLRQYGAVVGRVIPAIVANEETQSTNLASPSSQPPPEKDLLPPLEPDLEPQAAGDLSTRHSPAAPNRLAAIANESTWRQLWMLYAAGVLLFLTLGFYAYRLGGQRGDGHDPSAPQQAAVSLLSQAALEEQLSDAGHEREVARAQIQQRNQTIAELRRQLTQQSIEMDHMKAAQAQLESELRASNAHQEDFIQQRGDLAQQLESAQNRAHVLGEKLDSLVQQSGLDMARAKALETKTDDLSRLLQDREAVLEQQDQLLAHDRDIRELMGARDLYIAEVYDVSGTGDTKKPYGRVFYTRGKSLVFYAYDLDQQAEVKTANAFQAWGRRGPDRQTALSLGIFFEDSASGKRWIMKCEDPKTLAQIDAVFVTIEPNGGSHRPSSKTLLFAYLKINPNHP